jgi:predicted dehydrogenase
VKIAVVGCGAVAERGHLPALKAASCFDVVALVDRNESRARALAESFGVRNVFTDFARALPEVDAAIVALPHNLHAPVSMPFLQAGKHVLVEKPMGLSGAECSEMLAVAKRSGACLSVGHMRRFFPGLQLAKAWLARGLVGTVRRFDFRDGYTYSWPVASDFFFRKETAGGGVLLDTGAHTLDMLLWLLGDLAEFSYRDDSHGGVEADCLIELTLKSGAMGVVELSRTRILRNSAVIVGDEGEMEVFFHRSELVFRPKSGPAISVKAEHPGPKAMAPGLVQMLRDQLLDWYAAIVSGHEPVVSGRDGFRVVALMEEMYRRRAPLVFPWESVEPQEAAT